MDQGKWIPGQTPAGRSVFARSVLSGKADWIIDFNRQEMRKKIYKHVERNADLHVWKLLKKQCLLLLFYSWKMYIWYETYFVHFCVEQLCKCFWISIYIPKALIYIKVLFWKVTLHQFITTKEENTCGPVVAHTVYLNVRVEVLQFPPSESRLTLTPQEYRNDVKPAEVVLQHILQ